MTGHQERTEKIENKVKESLVNYPRLLTDYYYSLSDKTAETKKRYIMYVGKFMEYVSDELHLDNDSVRTYVSFRPSDINKYMEYIKYRNVNGQRVENGESIRAAKLSAITNFYNFLINEEYTDKNPCSKVVPPRSRKDKVLVTMTHDEINTLRRNIEKDSDNDGWRDYHNSWKSRDMAIITLGCRTGLRISAICDINISDINFNMGIITVTEKGNVNRDIFIQDDTIRVIREWIKDRDKLMDGYTGCDALFISNRRKRISNEAVKILMDKYTQGMGKHITPHKMRSTCGSNLYNVTHDIYLVQEVLGHRSIETTKRYVRVAENQVREASKIMDKI